LSFPQKLLFFFKKRFVVGKTQQNTKKFVHHSSSFANPLTSIRSIRFVSSHRIVITSSPIAAQQKGRRYNRASLRPGKASQKTRKRRPFCPQANEHRLLCVLLCSKLCRFERKR